MRHGWGIAGVMLGTWEAVAYATGRVPTISHTVALARRRWPNATTAVVIAWAAGTVRHLITYEL